MNDQAHMLRNLVRTNTSSSITTRIITVTSGKGGVGKSNFTLNFAISLQKKGFRVLIFDADIGLANIDVLMGITPEYNLYHLLKRQKTIDEIIYKGYEGLQFIAGGSGFNDLVRLSDEELNYFANEVSRLHGKVDYIIFDTGAGLSKESLRFILAAHETIVVTTPEPTSITDAYAIIKMVTNMKHVIRFRLVINRSTDEREGKQTADKITLVAKRFLEIDIDTLGFVKDDRNVTLAVKKQVPFSIAYPHSAASKSVQSIVNQYVLNRKNNDPDPISMNTPEHGVMGFMNKMLRLLKS